MTAGRRYTGEDEQSDCDEEVANHNRSSQGQPAPHHGHRKSFSHLLVVANVTAVQRKNDTNQRQDDSDPPELFGIGGSGTYLRLGRHARLVGLGSAEHLGSPPTNPVTPPRPRIPG